MMKKTNSLSIILLQLALLMVLFAAPAAQADPAFQSDPPDGLAIIFLIDQSGSMGGATYEASADIIPSDPLGLRFEAIQYSLETLSEYRATIAQNVDMMVAVINFGDTTELTLDWTSIETGPAWDTERAAITTQVSSQAFRDRNSPDHLSNTDFRNAMEFAGTIFERIPDDNYQRVLIILTDGQPCVPVRFNCESIDAQQAEMNALITLVETEMSADQYEIYVLGLDDRDQFWEIRRDDWIAVARDADHVTRLENSVDIGSSFLQILSDLISSHVIEIPPGEDYTVDVPPYISEIRVSIFKASLDPGQLFIQQPGGMIMTDSDPQITVENRDRPIEIWHIHQPNPGEWLFRAGSANDRLNVLLELIPTRVTTEVPERTFVRYEEAEIDITIRDEDGNLLPVYPPPYVLDVVLNVTLPDGTTEQVEAVYVSDGIYTARFPLEQAGTYVVGMTAQVQTSEGAASLYRDDQITSLEVSDYRIAIDQMPVSEYKRYQQAMIQVTVYGVDGASVTPDNLMLRSRLVDTATGEERLVSLQVDDGAYKATIIFEDAGRFEFLLESQFAEADNWEQIAQTITNVIASVPIGVAILEPEDKAVIRQSTGIPYIQEEPNTLTVLVQVNRLDTNQPINLANISGDPNALSIVLKDGDGKEHILSYAPVENTVGQYQTEAIALDSTGEWTITTTLPDTLLDNYVAASSNATAIHTVTIKANELLPLFYTAAGVLGVVLVSRLVFILWRRVQQRKHPCVGELQLVLSRDRRKHDILLEVSLDSQKKNQIRIGKGRLKKAAPGTNLSEILITCDSEQMSSNEQIFVTVKHKGKVIERRKLLSPGSSHSLTIPGISGQYQLLKDPKSRRR